LKKIYPGKQTVAITSSEAPFSAQCRSLARLRAADARLHQHDRNSKGEPIPERKRPYPLWGTSARDLAHAAPQLGVLTTTSRLLAVLMLLSCVACLYPAIVYGVRSNLSSSLRCAALHQVHCPSPTSSSSLSLDTAFAL
jgi:hypothetical protein